MTSPIELYFSYSSSDEALQDQFEAHLALLLRQNVVQIWHKRRIAPGEVRDDARNQRLQQANMILLLISHDYMASEECYKEMERALERGEAGEACVIPILLRPFDWQSAPFARLQVLPSDAQPVTSWPSRDAAWTNVTRGIRGMADALSAKAVAKQREAVAEQQAQPIILQLTIANYYTFVQNGGAVITLFSACWVRPSRQMALVVSEIAKEHSGWLRVGEVDIDANGDLARQLGIRDVPTLLFYLNGKCRDAACGIVSRDRLDKSVQRIGV